MQNELTTLRDGLRSLADKVKFLSDPSTYANNTTVEVLETHMSWVFLIDQYVYKLKKPVTYDFLDFKSPELRRFYCEEEVRINQHLASDIYVGVIPLNMVDERLQLDGEGQPIDWLVKMRRLPKEYMLDVAIRRGTVRNEWVQAAAEMLADFYMASKANKITVQQFKRQITQDIQANTKELLRKEFRLQKSVIVGIATDLLHFLVKHGYHFEQRLVDERLVDGHGDLRPEHICLAPKPVIIDRIEFNRNLRVLDVAEELSFLALECEILSTPAVGQLFFNIYKWKNHDNIPDVVIYFYKAKRAFLRAKLSIQHLNEKKYQQEEQKWVDRCIAYLQAADAYCERLPTDC